MKNEIIMVPLERIRILNPRHRDRRKFELIVQSIKSLGLKKPIQVSLRTSEESEGSGYDLVCGQGRIEAFKALGYAEIPATVVEISKEERLLRSLVENMARRFPAPWDLMREIERLRGLGYSNTAIGKKLDIDERMVGGFIALKRAGEERLLASALQGKIAISIAMEIARTKSVEDQRALLKAYEDGQLNYTSVRMVKRLINQRQLFGKSRSQPGERSRKSLAASHGLVTAYRRESERQKQLIRKAKICDQKLIFMVTAFSKLFADENFINLLRAESLATMPKALSDKITNMQQEAA